MKFISFSVLLALFTFSCGSDNPVSSELDGRYALQSMTFISNGRITASLEPPQVTGDLILSGSQYITAYSSEDGLSDSSSGTFTSSGSSIVFRSSIDGSTSSGQIDRGRILVSDSFVDDNDELIIFNIVFVRS